MFNTLWPLVSDNVYSRISDLPVYRPPFLNFDDNDEDKPHSSLVDFGDIDWMGAFTVETKILFPYGVNNSVEVLGPQVTPAHKVIRSISC